MARDIHGSAKSGRRGIDHAPLQVVPRRKRDRVQEEIELTPSLRNFGKQGVELALILNVTGAQYRAIEVFDHRPDMGFGFGIQVGRSQAGPAAGERPGATGRNALGIGDANHQTALAAKIDQG